MASPPAICWIVVVPSMTASAAARNPCAPSSRRLHDLELGDAVDDEGCEVLVVDLVGLEHRGGRGLERGFVDASEVLTARAWLAIRSPAALFDPRESLCRPVHTRPEIRRPWVSAQGQESPVGDPNQRILVSRSVTRAAVSSSTAARAVSTSLAILAVRSSPLGSNVALPVLASFDGVPEIVTQPSHLCDVVDQIVIELLPHRRLRASWRRPATIRSPRPPVLPPRASQPRWHRTVAQIGALDRLEMG